MKLFKKFQVHSPFKKKPAIRVSDSNFFLRPFPTDPLESTEITLVDGTKASETDLRILGALTLTLAGTSHTKEDLDNPSFAPGNQLILIPEPDNPYDPNAIAAWDLSQSYKAGYIPAHYTPEILDDLEDGHQLETVILSTSLDRQGKRNGLHILISGRDPDHPPTTTP